LAELAQAAAAAGDLDRLRALAEQVMAAALAITEPGRQAQVLGHLAAAAATGDQSQAEAAARAISDPDRQARVLAELAKKAEPSWARSLIARALMAGHWLASADVLVQIDPAAVINIADEYLSVTPLSRPS
jgi:chorismate mutase